MLDLEGRYIGNYRLQHLIGRGAFANVYLGTHVYLKSRAAIKILHAHVDSHPLDRFITEARHLSRLTHPHIIRILDVDIEDQTPYMVMEYAPRGNMRQVYPGGTVVPLPAVVSSVTTIALALQYAHDQQIIHCDLKPENVLLGVNNELLLADFGLAWFSSERDAQQEQEHFGTLAYMSPELIRNQPCPASDQYALAVMAYEWLTGRRPFEGTTADLVNQHLFTSPVSLCEQRPELPSSIEQVIFRALAKEPTERYRDVFSFATVLQRASQDCSSLLDRTTEVLIETDAARSLLSNASHPLQKLPVPLSPLVGREHELEVVCSRLLRPEVRLLTLIGTPGVGKTRLALALGTQLREVFAQGVFFVSLASVDDPELVISAIAHTFGLPDNETYTVFERVKRFLHNQQLLLLLDTFEQVLPAAPRLAELLEACPRLKIVVTSRAALHVRGEYEFIVPPLAVPDLNALPSLSTLAQVASISLFVQRAEALKPGFRLTENNATLIAWLCIHLEGVPLAIELAAVRSKLLSLRALCSRIEQGLEVLTGGKQDVPLRQQTLHNTISWSYDLLSSDEQTFFRRLCTFTGTFTLDAAEAVVRAPGELSLPVLDGIASLFDKSLLQRREEEGHEPRLYLPEIVRAYGRERLITSRELIPCQQAHADYYLALTRKAEKAFYGTEQAFWLEVLEAEYDENIRIALEGLLERRETESALHMVCTLRQFWFLRGRLSDGRKLLEQALKNARQDDRLNASWPLAKALYVTGYIAMRQQDPEPAAIYLEASLERFGHLKDAKGIAFSLHRLGYTLALRGKFAQGRAKMEESLSLLQDIGAQRDCADVLHSLGIVAMFQGQYSEAQAQFGKALALFEAEGDAWGKAIELHYLGVVFLFQGDPARALSSCEESLALSRKMDEPCGTSEVLTALASALLELGEMARADALLQEALALARVRESIEVLARVLCGVAYLHLQQGHLDEARAYLEEGVIKMQGKWFDPRSKWALGRLIRALGARVLARGDAIWAVQLCAAAESIYEAHGYSVVSGGRQASFERTLTEAHTILGERDFAAAWAAGQAMPPHLILRAVTPIQRVEEVSPGPATRPRRTPDLLSELTTRETEVLCFLATGMTNGQIAEQLVVSPFTVNRHTQSIYSKLGVNSRSAATRYAIEHHLLQEKKSVQA